jgi:hypothetical protein
MRKSIRGKKGGLATSADQAGGATLRRCLACWSGTGLPAKGHALLVGMLRGHPELILDSCSVRAKRGGDLAGPNPTKPCSPTKAMTPSRIASRVAPSELNLVPTSAVNRMSQDWACAAGRSNAAMPGSWRTGAWHCAMTGSASSSNRCARPHAYFPLRPGSPVKSENCL